MTATGPRPQPAAMLAARLAPTEALAVPDNDNSEDADAYRRGDPKYIGRLTTPDVRAWEKRQDRRDAEDMAARLDRNGAGHPGGRKQGGAAVPMTQHDIL